ncbi:MAG: glycosyltransferase [Mariprofundaceae bacterium]
MKILCIFGQHNYGNPERGLGYEYTNFIPALKNLGHEVVFFESLNKSMYSDFADMNRQLLQMVEAEKPDLVFCVLMTYEIWLETLQLIREGSDAALIHWATDDSWKYEQSSRLIASAFDVMTTTYPSAIKKSLRDGLDNFVLSQWAANSEAMHEPLSGDSCRYPVSFIGTAYGNRIRWIKALKQRGIEVDCFGHGWANGTVAAEDIPRIMRQSLISLNFADSGVVMKGLRPVRSRQIKARVFEVPGAGGLLVSEAAEGLDEFYKPGEEIVVFDTPDELAEKIRHMLRHPEERDGMAQAAHLRTRHEHCYEMRFRSLLRTASKRALSRVSDHCTAHKKTHDGIDFEAFEAIAARAQPSLPMRGVGKLLQLVCTLLWGSQRGPRAARRFLFELSWRLVGRKTYMAGGCPGSLFYHES